MRLIVNPTARRGAVRTQITPVANILREHGWAVEVIVTTSAQHAFDVAANASSDDLLVALGGDGLHGRVAAGAVESRALMAALPAGRGNDFARALGGSTTVLGAARALATADEQRIDVGRAGDEVFLGVVTIGYDSRANAYANNAPAVVPSSLVYAFGGARALVHTRRQAIGLTVDGVEHRFDGWNIAVGNSGRYGAGMRVNPNASMTDGLLDVTVVTDLPRWQYPMILPKLYRGTHIDGRHIRHFRGQHISVDVPEDMQVYADGDLLASAPRVFTTAPSALRVLTG